MAAPEGDGGFRTTHWSVVLAAGGEDAGAARAALETLCASYWYPLYAFVRHKGYGVDEAQDLTQGFFARLLEKRDLAGVDPTRGRFRAFLLASIQHFVANQWNRDHALKRGAGRVLALDLSDADERYGRMAARGLSPEEVYERSWALALLERVLANVRADYARRGDEVVFDTLKSCLTAEGDAEARRVQAERLGTSEGAVKVAVHRLRARYGEALRSEIAATVRTREEVEDEIRALFEALGGA